MTKHKKNDPSISCADPEKQREILKHMEAIRNNVAIDAIDADDIATEAEEYLKNKQKKKTTTDKSRKTCCSIL